MKAIIITKYGSPKVLQLQDVPKPLPKEKEILIKVKAASVTRADTMMRSGNPWYGRLFIGLTKPKYPIAGTGFSGIVEAVGGSVQRFQVGDEVFGESIFGAGSNAEYLCVSEEGLVAVRPKNVAHEELAGVCDGPLTSWNYLKEMANVKSGQRVLINGASGSLGSAAVQLANYLGADVTAVCSSSNFAMVRSLGADHAIDYTKVDFTKTANSYDVIFDTVGKSSFPACKEILTKNGTYLSPVLSMPLLFQMLWTSKFGSKKAKFAATGLVAVPKLRNMLHELTNLLNAGKLKLVIDKRYTLHEVDKAHSYVDTGRKRGNVVINL
ncbi:NAD(P)-dependent alcohol dehydrogenase [Arenibacter echinorum]|uniref:NADPH:quinone reductase-like Zn-dependent oxidoreductase n=1 Tax=Arenibacter echinorum TaxID=440515 RepID=A0A327R6H9_9FLAO|nr:NAD(P)-dependent alcohol dehydrogenase [Arenibacter echinorum]RAJ11304.1 NADPH:quinone reductase-like Zn-dependent oxidoreductase [Arenibacter echinorum]